MSWQTSFYRGGGSNKYTSWVVECHKHACLDVREFLITLCLTHQALSELVSLQLLHQTTLKICIIQTMNMSCDQMCTNKCCNLILIWKWTCVIENYLKFPRCPNTETCKFSLHRLSVQIQTCKWCSTMNYWGQHY